MGRVVGFRVPETYTDRFSDAREESSFCPCCKQTLPVTDEIFCSRVNRTIIFRGKSVTLTISQFDLLESLARRYPSIVTRENLMSMVYGSTVGYSKDIKSVDCMVTHVRKALKESNMDLCIKTIYGTGYKLMKGLK